MISWVETHLHLWLEQFWAYSVPLQGLLLLTLWRTAPDILSVWPEDDHYDISKLTCSHTECRCGLGLETDIESETILNGSFLFPF